MDFQCPESLQMRPTFTTNLAIENPFYSPSHFTSNIAWASTRLLYRFSLQTAYFENFQFVFLSVSVDFIQKRNGKTNMAQSIPTFCNPPPPNGQAPWTPAPASGHPLFINVMTLPLPDSLDSGIWLSSCVWSLHLRIPASYPLPSGDARSPRLTWQWYLAIILCLKPPSEDPCVLVNGEWFSRVLQTEHMVRRKQLLINIRVRLKTKAKYQQSI